MKKQTKAALAAGAGVLLLLGGAGSLAYWHDETNIGDGATITSGTLSLGDCTDAAWSVEHHVGGVGGVTTPVDPSNFLIVPGDVLRYSCNTTVQGSGDHLSAQVTADLSNVFTDDALGRKLQENTTVAVNLDGTEVTGTSPVISSWDGTARPVTVSIQSTFPDTVGNGAGNGAELQDSSTAVLDNLAIVLQQVDWAGN